MEQLIDGEHLSKLFPAVVAELFFRTQQQVAFSLDNLLFLSVHVAAYLPAHLIYGIVDVLGDVERIKGSSYMRQILLLGFEVSVAPINAYHLYILFLLLRKLLKEAI